jgi:heterodisulfide reductase subunit D
MPSCPSGERFGFKSYYASGRLEIARGLIEGKIPWSDKLVHRLYTCTGCGICNELCYPITGIKPLDVITEMRRELVRRDIVHPRHKEFAESIKRYHNPFMKPHEKRLKWFTENVVDRAKILYFVGCQTSYVQPEIANATVKILRSARVQFTMMPDEWCCGYPLLHTGQLETAKDLIKHNIEAIKRAGAEVVLFSCPGCYLVFKQEYPEISGKSLPFDVVHTSEYFAKMIEEGTIKPTGKISKTVTYHDPCALGRLSKLFDPPRKMLESIPELKLVEMERTRQYAWCCGAGGGVMLAYPDLATWTALDRLREAEATNANVLATACPACKYNLAGTANSRIEIYDINELLAMTIS